jgi:ABC-2 type transport system permease protein
MPIFDQGYQHWHGRLRSHRWAWLAIAGQGIRTQFRNRWTKIVLSMALAPAMSLAAFAILWGLCEQKAALIQPLLAWFRELPEVFKTNPSEFRVPVWSFLLFFFFQIQRFFSMLLVLVVGPALISQDLRYNAVPLYYSRPLTRADYFLGKLGVIAGYLGAVTVLPLTLAYVLGTTFSADVTVLRDTFRLYLAGIVYSAVIIVSCGTLVLALSSLSRNSRYVGAMWVAVWIISNSLAEVFGHTLKADWSPAVSYTQNLRRLAERLFDLPGAAQRLAALLHRPQIPGLNQFIHTYPWYWSALVLSGLCGASIWVLTTRVRSLDRLK